MKILTLSVLALASISGQAAAQSTEAAISARLIDKPLQLRGFWIDDDLKFDSAGAPLDKYAVGSFTVSALDVQKVHLAGDHLKIEGRRVALTFDKAGSVNRVPLTKSKLLSRAPEKILIDIDGQGNGDFGKELDAIFAISLKDIEPSLPSYWQPYAKTHFLSDEVQPPVAVEKKLDKDSGVSAPKLLKQPNATFSNVARHEKYSGDVLIDLVVDEIGLPVQIHVTRPTGMGLDEQALATVSEYRFKPATKGGKPVKVEVTVLVSFQVF